MPQSLWYPTRDSLDTIASLLPAGPFSESPDTLDLVVRDEALLDSALATVRQPYYPSLIDKAAALLRSLVKNHPFVDGNKRMALLVTLDFLWANGYVFAADEQEAGDLVLDVAESNPSITWEDISDRMARYVFAVNDAERALADDPARLRRAAWQIQFVPEFALQVRGIGDA